MKFPFSITIPHARASAPKNPARSAGFSLIELLMSITALILIVLVIALVFQQTHSAWGTGIRRAGVETTLRSVMGTIERDLTHAVDDATFVGLIGPFNVFPAPGSSALTIKFIALDGTNRLPHWVWYTFASSNLTRQTFAASSLSSATNWTFAALSSTAIINGDQPLTSCTFSVPAGTPPDGLPLRVEIEAHAKKGDSFALVSGWSEGRNRPGRPEDRIVSSP